MSIVAPHQPAAEDVPLFDGYEPPEQPEPTPDLSADQRRTVRQAEQIAAGVHPLTASPIHPLASRHRDATAPKTDPFTCGSCYFRHLFKHHNRTYPKCVHPGTRSADEYAQFGPPRHTNGAASDVRAWWPACGDYTPGDSLSPDAARSIPEATD